MEKRNAPGFYPFETTLLGWPSVFGGLFVFLAVLFWLSWVFDPDPVQLAVPIGFTSLDIGLPVLWRRSTLRLTEDGRLRVRFFRLFGAHDQRGSANDHSLKLTAPFEPVQKLSPDSGDAR